VRPGFLGLLWVLPLMGTEGNICMHANVTKKHAVPVWSILRDC
jgi:hypothetical protein